MEWTARGADPAEPLLREVPSGVTVESSVEIPAAQTSAIGQKRRQGDGDFGVAIARTESEVFRPNGFPLGHTQGD